MAAATIDGLTNKQAMFVREYLLDLNGTQSAIRAGYSEATAAEQAVRLLSNVKVRDAVNAGLAKRATKLEIKADWLLDRLVKEATADIADLIEEDTGALKPVHEWPQIWRTGLVAGIEIEEEYDTVADPDTLEGQPKGGALVRRAKRKVAVGRVTKIKFADRLKRLELVGRHVNVNAFKHVEGDTATDPAQQLIEAIGGFAIRPQAQP